MRSADPAADWHLLAGDEAGLPAISAALEALPPNAIGKAFIEVGGPDDEIRSRRPRGRGALDLPRWTRRPGGRGPGRRPRAAGRRGQGGRWLPGQVQVFVHGEAQAVMHNLRPYMRKERGVEAKWAPSPGTGAGVAPKKRSGSGRRNWQGGGGPATDTAERLPMAFGDYQLEIYLQGLSGIVPSLPMAFAELEAKAQAAMSPSVWSYVAGGAGDERTQRVERDRVRRTGA